MSSGLIPIVGFVGGVGSGKSTLAAELSRQWRAAVLNADDSGHAALRSDAVKSQLRSAFGTGIFDETGEVVRTRLASQVFGDSPETTAQRRKLEAIVHPVIRSRLQQRMEELRTDQACELIVLDAAVMLESGWSTLCDAIVFVDAPRHVRLERVRRSRGWSDAELERREASQWPLDRKLDAADFVVTNNSDPASAARPLIEFLSRRFPQLPDRRGTLREPAATYTSPQAG